MWFHLTWNFVEMKISTKYSSQTQNGSMIAPGMCRVLYIVRMLNFRSVSLNNVHGIEKESPRETHQAEQIVLHTGLLYTLLYFKEGGESWKITVSKCARYCTVSSIGYCIQRFKDSDQHQTKLYYSRAFRVQFQILEHLKKSKNTIIIIVYPQLFKVAYL